MKETIMILCAHSDDEAAGMGGTIYKYLNENKKLVKIIFSFGQLSHPHIQEKITTKTRVKETKKISDNLGIETLFFGLSDTRLLEDIKKRKIKQKLKTLIEKYKPKKIFMPSSKDIHPDHRAVNLVTQKALKELNNNIALYSFEVWNMVKENKPAIYNDITPYYKKKINLMKAFKSQKHFMYPLLLPIYIRSRLYGRKINKMKILFIVTGVGYGDSKRSHAIINEFLRKDPKTKIKIACYDKSYEYFKNKFPVIKIAGYKLRGKKMRIKATKFILRNYFLPFSWIYYTAKIKKETKKFNPDIIISDFEPIGSALGLLIKKPCIFIFGYDPDLFEKIPDKNSIMYLEAKYFERVYKTSKHVIIPSFIPKKSKKYQYVNQIVIQKSTNLLNKKTLMRKLKLKKEPIIVMLGGSYFGGLLAKKILKLAEHLNEHFIIFGSNIKIKKRKNVTYYKFKENYLEYLKVSKAVISLAGQLTLTEAITFKKPVMIFPIQNHVEQLQNAYVLRDNAYIKYDFKNMRKSVCEFLNNLNKIKPLKLKTDGAKQVVDYVYKLIK